MFYKSRYIFNYKMTNVCLISFASLWFFGPYGKQLMLLSKKLQKKYNIFYLSLDIDLEKRKYTYKEVLKLETDHVSLNKSVIETVKNITFIGGVKKYDKGILISSINDIINHFNLVKKHTKRPLEIDVTLI